MRQLGQVTPTRIMVRSPGDFVVFPKEAIGRGIHGRFEDVVRRDPERIAITDDGQFISYGRLNGYANSLAEVILAESGHALNQVAILLPNSATTIVCMLGALKARKAYVPLDIHFPAERLRAMLADADPVLLLTDTAHLGFAVSLGQKRVRVIDVDALTLYAEATNLRVSGEPMDRAYILYTSGSTGRPKGIEFLHRNLLHTTMCLTNQLFFSPSDRVTWLHSPTFGSSVVDIYCCLANGGTLLPWDVKTRGFNGLADWLVREQATTLQWIPSAFRQFVRTLGADRVLASIRIVVMAGEPLTIREVEMFRRHFPIGSHLVNQVGTAESYNYYLYCLDHELALEGASVPGGYPVSVERELLILDELRRPVAAGSSGEIAIRSEYMAAGYWNDERQTRERFVYLEGDHRPVYLTGDVGKVGADGCLTHLGRGDFQIKLRGCRVEVAEIEHLLGSIAGIADSAAWVAKNRLGDEQLVGYVVLKPAAVFDQEATISSLAERLPDYMVPRHYVVMDALPLLPTGKVDRKGLPNPFGEDRRNHSLKPEAGDSIENELIGFFRETLDTGAIHRNSDFVREGGDSLLAAVLAERIFRRFGVDPDLQKLMDSLTPARLAAALEARLSGRTEDGTAVAAAPIPASALRVERPSATQNAVMTRPGHSWQSASDAAAGEQSIQELLIIGAGQCGRELYTWATQAIAAGAPWRIKGFLDSRPDVLRGYDYEAGIVGTPDGYPIGDNDFFLGALGDPRDKKKFYSPIIEKGGEFINLIHPLANIGKNVRFGSNVVLGPFASVTADVCIGSNVSIGAFSNVAHDVVVGDWCQISSHCGLNGKVELAEGVFLGSHACVIPGVKVGAWAYIGAGSIVIKDLGPGRKVFGNPARVLGTVRAG